MRQINARALFQAKRSDQSAAQVSASHPTNEGRPTRCPNKLLLSANNKIMEQPTGTSGRGGGGEHIQEPIRRPLERRSSIIRSQSSQHVINTQ